MTREAYTQELDDVAEWFLNSGLDDYDVDIIANIIRSWRPSIGAVPVRHLYDAADDMCVALEDVEWVLVPRGWGSSDWECPWCERSKDDGHADSCARQAAIAKARGLTND